MNLTFGHLVLGLLQPRAFGKGMVHTMVCMHATRKSLHPFELEIREVLPKVDGVEDVMIFRRPFPLEEFSDFAVILRIEKATLGRPYPVTSGTVVHRIITSCDSETLL